MIVRCISNRDPLSSENTIPQNPIDITIGKEYIVLGICLQPTKGDNYQLYYIVNNDSDNVTRVAASRFALVDSGVSVSWRVGFGQNGEFLVQPPEFYEQYFLDDASNAGSDDQVALSGLIDRLEDEARKSN